MIENKQSKEQRKSVQITISTWKRLSRLRLDMNAKSIDEVILVLFSYMERYTNTENGKK